MIYEIHRLAQHAAIYSMLHQELLDKALKEAIGTYSWHIDIPDRVLTFTSVDGGGEVTCEGDTLASVAVHPATLLWGYAKFFAPYVGDNPAARQIRSFGEEYQLESLTQEEVPYEFDESRNQLDAIVALSHNVGMLASVVYGPEAYYYTGPTGNAGARQTYLVRNPSVEIAPVTVRELFPRLARYGILWSWRILTGHLRGWESYCRPGPCSGSRPPKARYATQSPTTPAIATPRSLPTINTGAWPKFRSLITSRISFRRRGAR